MDSIHVDDSEQVEQEENEQEQEGYTQEAFTPIFQVVQEEIPEQTQTHIPTQDEQKQTVEGIYKKLGVKAKEFIDSEPQEITPQINENIKRGSLMAARIFSAISMWGFSVFGVEYGQAAPTVDHSYRMIEPLLRITARHTPIVGKISPDVEDAIESATAMSDYALYAMNIMSQIREDKLANNGRYTGTAYRPTTGETGFNGNGSRSNDIRGFTTHSNEPHEATRGEQHTDTQEHLTNEQQFNRDMLHQLSIRDFETRAKRSGRL